MADAVERVVDEVLSDRSVEAVDSQTTRPGNETARVTFADGPPRYVKVTTDGSARIRREAAAIRYASATCPVETPVVEAAAPSGDPPYLVTRPLPGTPLNEPWTDGADREALLAQLGRAIAGVHEARFDRPGLVTGGDADGLELAAGTWTDVLCRTVERRSATWFADRFSDLPGRLVETIRAVEPSLGDATPALLHGDPSRLNLHLEPLGLLDWERALVGDPAFGLVEAEFHHLDQPDVSDEERPALQAALHEGYREVAGGLPAGLAEKRPLYRAVAYLLVPQAFDDWVPDAPKPPDEMASEVREEFDARLAAAREAA